tara:strand:+ start:86 stop:1219 length:1134 start_codon:yes stop_codon:yes gene_type:complete
MHNVLNLGLHPLCDDLIGLNEDRVCREFPIEILFCKRCLTAHQRFQVSKKLLFHPDYHYRARMTGSVLSGMKDFVEGCEKNFGSLKNKTVLDIGCNDGSLLNFFKEKGSNTYGIEPTDAALDSKHETYNMFFDKKTALLIQKKIKKIDFITFTNVFAHIENLTELIKNIKLISSKETKLIIENHYLGAIFKNSQFDTFYHEHPRTYSLSSFKFIAKSLKKEILDFQFVSRYGGNIRVFIGDGSKSSKTKKENKFYDNFLKLSKSMNKWITSTKKKINELNKVYGPVNAKAFPGRAAILIKLLNLNTNHIKAVYEIKGSRKVYHYVPGTKIPILPEKELYKQNSNKPILNLAWHIADEVEKNLKKNGFIGKIINIKEF